MNSLFVINQTNIFTELEGIYVDAWKNSVFNKHISRATGKNENVTMQNVEAGFRRHEKYGLWHSPK